MHRLPRNFARRNYDLFALGKFFDNILLDDGAQTSDDVIWPPYSSGSMTSLPPTVWQVLNGIITKFQNYSSRDCLHRFVNLLLLAVSTAFVEESNTFVIDLSGLLIQYA